MPLTKNEKVGSDPYPKFRNLVVLISGRGSNLQAIIDAIAARRLNARIAVVISNNADAAGLKRAVSAGIETVVLDHRDTARFPTRALRCRTRAASEGPPVRLVCLAGL
jgi:phosphoribosylglycinamide formyltransferase-1